MNGVQNVARIIAKAVFCLVISWLLTVLTPGYVEIYFQLPLPMGLLAIPGAFAMFSFLAKVEESSRKLARRSAEGDGGAILIFALPPR
jgi:hypothetical protein